jgi:hypothetical protein
MLLNKYGSLFVRPKATKTVLLFVAITAISVVSIYFLKQQKQAASILNASNNFCLNSY